MPENKLALIAYFESDGVRNMPDSYVENLYLRAEEEGLTRITFMDGSLNDSRLFLEDMKHGSHLFVIASGPEVAGFCWVNHVQQKSAYFHFCFFRKFWGHKAEEIAKFALNYILNIEDGHGGYLFDMLIGNTPLKNRAACRRIRKAPFLHVTGELPFGYFEAKTGRSIPSLFSYVTRETLN
ncbi:hypothetical protein [Maridesulfovibrio bastinii]|uniref:hypothetical protein n=1 Tax=Maridesulfovibrio bastinii TaxID=47157 RepID=UPI0003FD9283|nr:hypothetical protein [Maridesulfovibrio bastinii]